MDQESRNSLAGSFAQGVTRLHSLVEHRVFCQAHVVIGQIHYPVDKSWASCWKIDRHLPEGVPAALASMNKDIDGSHSGNTLTISSELTAYFCSGTTSSHSYLLKVLTKALLLPSSILECLLYCESSEKKNYIFTNLYFVGVQHIVSNYWMVGWMDGWVSSISKPHAFQFFMFNIL